MEYLAIAIDIRKFIAISPSLIIKICKIKTDEELIIEACFECLKNYITPGCKTISTILFDGNKIIAKFITNEYENYIEFFVEALIYKRLCQFSMEYGIIYSNSFSMLDRKNTYRIIREFPFIRTEIEKKLFPSYEESYPFVSEVVKFLSDKSYKKDVLYTTEILLFDKIIKLSTNCNYYIEVILPESNKVLGNIIHTMFQVCRIVELGTMPEYTIENKHIRYEYKKFQFKSLHFTY